MSGEEGRAFFGKGCCEKSTDAKRQRKRRLERFFKNWMPSTFVKGSCFGTPLYTTCKSNKGGDKRPSLRKKGRSWYEGEGGEGAGQIQGVKG